MTSKVLQKATVVSVLTIVAACKTTATSSHSEIEDASDAVALEQVGAIELLDALVRRAENWQYGDDSYLPLDPREEYVRAEDVPALLERLDSQRPCLNVAEGRHGWFDGLSTEGRQAAFLLNGFIRGQYPPTVSSAEFPYDAETIRAWWSLRQQGKLTCAEPAPSEHTLSDEEISEAKLDIAEVLLRGMFPESYIDMQPIFVEYDDQDPPAELLQRFASHYPKVNSISKFREITFVESDKRQPIMLEIPGTIYSVSNVRILSNDYATAESSYFKGALHAQYSTNCLRRENGRWVLVEISESRIS